MMQLGNDRKENFIEAIMCGEEERLNRALELGDININEFLDLGEIHQKMTPLYYAVNFGSNTEIVKHLCSTDGIDVNKGHVTGKTPLAAALLRGRTDVVETLLGGDDEEVEYDSMERTSKDDKPQNGKREKPLHFEELGDIKINDININEFLDLGEIHQKMTPLYHAVFFGSNTKIVKLLCSTDGIDVNKGHVTGRTPLAAAVLRGRADVVKILLECDDVEVDNIDRTSDDNKPQNRETPLHFAVKSGNLEIVKILIKQEVKRPDPNICNSNGDTALYLALKAKMSEIAETLLEHTDLNLCDRNGNTMIHLAIPIRNINLTSRIFEQIDDHHITAKNKWGETALRIYSQTKVNSRSDSAEYLLVLRLGFKTISEYESKLHRPPQFKFNEGLILDDIPRTLEKLMEGEVGTTVLEYLHKITNDNDASEDHKADSAVLMKFIIRGIKDNVENERLRCAFYKESNLRNLVQIFVDAETIEDELDVENLLYILYKSLQANIRCDFGSAEPKLVQTESSKRQVMTDFLKDKLSKADLFRKLRERLRIMTEGMGLKPSNEQLIAQNLYRTYFKSDEGKCCSSMKYIFEKKEEALSSCLRINELFHKCIVRGNFSFILCLNWICIYVFDVASDAIVGVKTLNGLSSRLGIFILVLVCVTLVHENVRSTLSTYQADRELLRICLGKFDLKREDYRSDSTMLNYHYDIKSSFIRCLARFVWPFRIHGHSSSLEKLRSILFNILSLLMLRPIVDRLIFLTHSPTSLRVIYRHKAKQVYLNQYYMITEQIPELLIQFYIFQIYFNLLSKAEDYQLTGCMGKHSFTYRREYFECVEDISRLKMCASWLEIFSMLVPFFKIPHTLVSLENMCRILHPISQEMSGVATGFLYIAYILMIPSRLFLLSALMHAAPDHLSVVYYFVVITVCIMLYNLKRAKFIDTRLPCGFSCFWPLLLFSIRDMMVISLRNFIGCHSIARSSTANLGIFRGSKK